MVNDEAVETGTAIEKGGKAVHKEITEENHHIYRYSMSNKFVPTS